MEFILSDGIRMTLENCGDTVLVQRWDENGNYIDECCWDIDSFMELLFE